jgi:hypothetical protein
MNYSVDTRLSMYRPHLEDPDGETLHNAAQGTRFEDAAFDLLRAWRQNGNARGLPFILGSSAEFVGYRGTSLGENAVDG